MFPDQLVSGNLKLLHLTDILEKARIVGWLGKLQSEFLFLHLCELYDQIFNAGFATFSHPLTHSTSVYAQLLCKIYGVDHMIVWTLREFEMRER